MNKIRSRSTAIIITGWISGWNLILCFALFQVLNIWGVIYPLLCISKKIKICYSNRLSNLLLCLLNVIALLRIPIFLIAFFYMPILVSRILRSIIETYPYFHINDHYCTVDWVCDDELKRDYLWKLVYASFVIIIDFIWIRPKIYRFYDWFKNYKYR